MTNTTLVQTLKEIEESYTPEQQGVVQLRHVKGVGSLNTACGILGRHVLSYDPVLFYLGGIDYPMRLHGRCPLCLNHEDKDLLILAEAV